MSHTQDCGVRSSHSYGIGKLCSPLLLTPCDLCMFRFMIIFTLCFMMGKAHDWGTFLKCKVQPNYHLVLGLLFWECPTLGLTLYQDKFMNLCIYAYTQQDLKHEWNKKNRNSLFNFIHVRPTYFYTSYLSLRMEIIVDTLITKTSLRRARGLLLFVKNFQLHWKGCKYPSS
jgi:hypothetical protein